MTKQTNEELREKIRRITCQIFLDATEPCHGELILTDVKNLTVYDNEIMSLIPQPEQTIWPEGNYMSLVNGSGTHCKECGKRL